MVRIDRKEELLTQERLKEVLEYNLKTGELVWIERKQGRKFGQVAGCLEKSNGYVKIDIDGDTYYAHRLVWLYVYGYFPKGDKPLIDHVDGNPSNNRIDNLKECCHAENMRNTKMMSNNTSGVTGVYLNQQDINGRLYQYWITTWNDASGKLRQKCFSVLKLGYEKAEQMAITYRNEQIRLLLSGGITYSVRHGVDNTI